MKPKQFINGLFEYELSIIAGLTSVKTEVSIQNLKNDVLYKGIMKDFIDDKHFEAFVDKIVCRISVSDNVLKIVVD